jgi:hypothetical protein
MPESGDVLYNLTNSLIYFLENQVLKKDSTSKSLTAWYANPALKIILDFPDDLGALALPTLALKWVSNPGTAPVFYGDSQGNDYAFILWGFSGGETTEAKNKAQRDKLIGDAVSLLENASITVYSWSGATRGAEIGAGQVIGRISPQSLPKSGQTEADKYRFSIGFSVRLFEQNT